MGGNVKCTVERALLQALGFAPEDVVRSVELRFAVDETPTVTVVRLVLDDDGQFTEFLEAFDLNPTPRA